MKNLLTLAAICLFTISAAAQKITTKDLTGTWKMTAVTMFGNYVDFATEKITFSEDWKADNAGADLAALEATMLEQLGSFKAMGFAFTDTKMSLDMEGIVVEEMDYKIIDREGKQYLETPDDPTDSPEIKLANGVLEMHLNSDEGPVTMIFKKA